jgi:predicted GIY-YIG superfamily endonuclease
MPIDGQKKTFQEITSSELPSLMEKLNAEINNPLAMEDLTGNGIGIKTALKKLNFDEDFPGCYVLIDKSKPYYVGVSQNLITRLQQHVKGHDHYSASLAFRIAKIDSEIMKKGKNSTRDELLADSEFKDYFEASKKRIQNSKVAFVEIDDHIILYLFEVYAATELDTDKYNSFKTH